MKKIILIYLLASICILPVTGCGNKIPDMDETSQKMIVEYAADVVRNHDMSHSSRLMEVEALQDALEEEAMLEAVFSKDYSKDVNLENEEDVKSDEKNESIDTNDNVATVKEKTVSMTDALSLENTDIQYAGYEVLKSYPNDSENIYFTLDATSGNELVVLKFDITNTSQADKTYDILSKGVCFKIVVNGKSKNALTTMLLNDLANYQGTIAAGAKEQLVVIGEITEEEAQNLSDLLLDMKTQNGIVSITL